MNRRRFFGGIGAVAAAVVAAPFIIDEETLAAAPAPSLAATVPTGGEDVAFVPRGTRHFAILMNIHGQAVRTMMVDNLPQEIHITRAEAPTLVFRLANHGVYDGMTVEGLARYILLKGVCTWPTIALGL